MLISKSYYFCFSPAKELSVSSWDGFGTPREYEVSSFPGSYYLQKFFPLKFKVLSKFWESYSLIIFVFPSLTHYSFLSSGASAGTFSVSFQFCLLLLWSFTGLYLRAYYEHHADLPLLSLCTYCCYDCSSCLICLELGAVWSFERMYPFPPRGSSKPTQERKDCLWFTIFLRGGLKVRPEIIFSYRDSQHFFLGISADIQFYTDVFICAYIFIQVRTTFTRMHAQLVLF